MNINDILDKRVIKMFGEDYIKVLTENLLRAGKEASGKLIQSLDWRVSGNVDTLSIFIEGEDYLLYVDKGRRAGVKPPPISALKSWCKIKGLDEGLAFPIQKSIFKFGIPATNVIQKTNERILRGPYVGLDIIADNIEKKFLSVIVNGDEEIKRIKK
jgi:hypothetical protein